MSKNPKIKYSGFHYDDSVDSFVRYHFSNTYVAVLFDVNRLLTGSNTDEILEFKKRYWLEDVSLADMLHSEWCVIEFEKKSHMEEYLYEIGDGYVYAKFYNKGALYEEICEPEDH